MGSLYPNIGNLTNSDARAVGVLIVLNDVRSDVKAYVHNAANLEADALAITALENAELAADAEINVSALRRGSSTARATYSVPAASSSPTSCSGGASAYAR